MNGSRCLVAALAAGVAWACSGSVPRTEEQQAQVCAIAPSVKDEPSCVTETFGIFVDASGGDDSNPGTRSRPFRTLVTALARRPGNALVFVCSGTYAERVVIVNTEVALLGGYACGSWRYDGSRPRVVSEDGKRATITGAEARITLVDLEIVAPSLGAPNSIAIELRGGYLSLDRSVVEARRGADGTAGALETIPYPTQDALDGKDATPGSAGKPGMVSCGFSGGAGGLAGQGAPGGPPDTGGTDVGSVSPTCSSPGPEGNGGRPAPPPALQSYSGFLGSFDDRGGGWSPRNGDPGHDGFAGGSGAGGSGVPVAEATGPGGGGGAGGCGGAGGGGGTGGGASIAIVSSFATLSSNNGNRFSTGAAGRGGDGAPGQKAQQIAGRGGRGFNGGCSGGNGALGTDGLAGEGGAGGISVAIASNDRNERPTSATVELGSAGLGGSRGLPNQGPDGVSQSVFVLE